MSLAGEGLKLAGSGFDLPDSVTDYTGAAKHLADHALKHFRISMPENLISTLADQMSGSGMDWNSLDTRLSGLVTP